MGLEKIQRHHLLIVVLAAGSSKRFGRKNKLLETFNEKLVLETTLENVLKVFNTDKIIVITGYQNNKIEQIIEKYNVKSFFNKNYTLGIGTSISSAIKENKIDFDGALILPGDMPLISTLDFKNLVNAFYQNNKTKIISPRFKNKNGKPVILQKTFFKLFKSLKNVAIDTVPIISSYIKFTDFFIDAFSTEYLISQFLFIFLSLSKAIFVFCAPKSPS